MGSLLSEPCPVSSVAKPPATEKRAEYDRSVRTLAFIAFAAAVAGAALNAGAVAERPGESLRLLSLQPLRIQGQHFAAREHVRVDLSGSARKRVRVVTTGTGSFTVRFHGIVATRCDVIRVVAIGSSGSRARLKYLPAPACLPA